MKAPNIDVSQLKAHFDEILEAVKQGRCFYVTEHERRLAELRPAAGSATHPVCESEKGRIQIADDFDAPVPGMEEYGHQATGKGLCMPGSCINPGLLRAVQSVPTPCYVLDRGRIAANLAVLGDVQQRTGCKILLALKGFAMFSLFPLIRETLPGVCASGPHEAKLGREEFGGEVHVFSPAYTEGDVRELVTICDHIVFNSFTQWNEYRAIIEDAERSVECGLRINPEHREAEVELYDPCAPGSRLGIRREQFEGESLDGISGLHFHTLCEQNADALARTVAVVEEKFAEMLHGMKWLNLGGGHHITRPDYDVDALCETVERLQETYGIQVYLEPGEAIALNAGVLVASVLDIVHNEQDIAILDTSVTCHMPDVLEMPYRPRIAGAADPNEKAHTYRLGGLSCLAGDVVGDYSFDEPLQVGSRLVFEDMAHYTMVKTTTFNGVKLPAIGVYSPQADSIEIVREFGYEDYRGRLS